MLKVLICWIVVCGVLAKVEVSGLLHGKREASSCVEQCRGRLNGRGFSLDENVDFLRDAKFKENCDEYINQRDCINLCPNSTEKQNLQITTAPLDQMCVEYFSTLQKNRNCLTYSLDRIVDTCKRTCDKPKTSLEELTHTIDNPNSSRLKKFKAAAQGYCQTTQCRSTCMKTEVRKKCGKDVAIALGDISGSDLEVMKNLFDASTLPKLYWPKYCDKVVRDLAKMKRKYKNKGDMLTSGLSVIIVAIIAHISLFLSHQ